MQIALKLARFRKPTFIDLKSGAGRTTCIFHNYLTSILQFLTSSYKPVFIGLNYRCGLHMKLKELLYSQNTSIEYKEFCTTAVACY